jgi:predicted permease
MTLFPILLPFFGLIALGYFAGRLGWINEAGVAGMNAFVIKFAMPCLIISVIAASQITELVNPRFLVSYLVAEILIYGLAMAVSLGIFKTSLAEAALMGLGASWGNVGYMGIPLSASLFGAEAAVPALVATAADMAVVTGITVLLVEYDAKRGQMSVLPLLSNLGAKLLFHPFIITLILGVVLSATGVGIPGVLQNSVKFLSGAAGPSALFAIGASLAVRPLMGERTEIIAPIALKLFALPLAFLGLALAVGLEPLWLTTGLVLTALPTAGNVFVLAEQAGKAVQRVSAIILVSTLMSIATVVALLTQIM